MSLEDAQYSHNNEHTGKRNNQEIMNWVGQGRTNKIYEDFFFISFHSCAHVQEHHIKLTNFINLVSLRIKSAHWKLSQNVSEPDNHLEKFKYYYSLKKKNSRWNKIDS